MNSAIIIESLFRRNGVIDAGLKIKQYCEEHQCEIESIRIGEFTEEWTNGVPPLDSFGINENDLYYLSLPETTDVIINFFTWVDGDGLLADREDGKNKDHHIMIVHFDTPPTVSII